MTDSEHERPIELSYVLDEPTFLEAGHALWRAGRNSGSVRARTLLLAAAIPVGLFLALQYGMWFVFLAILALAALHFVFDWPLTRAFMKHGFPQLPAANKALHWRIDETGVRVRVAGEEEAHIPWNAFIEVVEDEDGFILSQPHNARHWLPKKAFERDEDIERLRYLLHKHTTCYASGTASSASP